jgi:hypothetical protein
MNKSILCVVLTTTIFNAKTRAEENWAPRLAGVFEGSVAGALPPIGLYFVNETLLTGTILYNNAGDRSSSGVKSNIAVNVPIVQWVPGVKILGADYAVALAQPFDYVSTLAPGSHSGGTNLGTGSGQFNTLLIPAQLSWALPRDLHVKAGVGVYLPDGDFKTADKMAVPNGMGFWSLEPSIGVSWLRDGWNVSGSFAYDHNFKNNSTNYRSGDVIDGDYTLTKALSKWTIGVGGYTQFQLFSDTSNGVALADSRLEKVAAGPIIGYNIGPVVVQATYNFRLRSSNVAQGDEFWLNVTVPLKVSRFRPRGSTH